MKLNACFSLTSKQYKSHDNDALKMFLWLLSHYVFLRSEKRHNEGSKRDLLRTNQYEYSAEVGEAI